jgi:hypothetical protein
MGERGQEPRETDRNVQQQHAQWGFDLLRTMRFSRHGFREKPAHSARNSSHKRAIAQTAAIHCSLSFASSLIKLSVHNSVYISYRYRRDTGHFGRAYSTFGRDSDLGHSCSRTRGSPELRFSAHRTAPKGSTPQNGFKILFLPFVRIGSLRIGAILFHSLLLAGLSQRTKRPVSTVLPSNFLSQR